MTPARSSPLFKKTLLATTAVVLVPLLIVTIVAFERLASRQLEQAEQYLLQLSRSVHSQVEQIVSETDNFMLFLASSPQIVDELRGEGVGPEGRLEITQFLNESNIINFFTHRTFFRGLVLFDVQGVVYATPSDLDLLPVDRLFGAMSGDRNLEFLVLSPDDGLGLNRTHTVLARKLFAFSPRTPRGVAIAEISSPALRSFWSVLDLEGGEIMLLGSDGRFIFHSSPELIGSLTAEILPATLLDSSLEDFTVRYAEEKMFVLSSPGTAGSRTAVSLPLGPILEPIRSTQRALAIIASALFLVGFVLSFVLIHTFLDPLQYLREGMKRTRDGDLKPLTGRFPNDEIGEIIHHFNDMVGDIERLIDQVYEDGVRQQELEVEKQGAVLQALQLQINPHFLYNTLGAIKSYALVSERKPMQELIDSLSAILRYAVHSPLQPATLADEIRHLRNYLRIQELRLPRMPELTIDVAGYEETPILRLSLQPIVENTFQYAFPDGIEEGHFIRISVDTRAHGEIAVVVEDNGAGLVSPGPPASAETVGTTAPNNTSTLRHTGIGLTNVDRRLGIAYAGNYGLTVCKRHGGGTRVELLIPGSKQTV